MLLKVRAAGVNWAEYSVLTGIPHMVRLGFGIRRPKLTIRGTDVVEAVGRAVSRLRVGEEVFGWWRLDGPGCVRRRN